MEFDSDFANSGIFDESSPDSLIDQLVRVDISKMQSRDEIDRELFGGPISSDESGESGVPEVAGSQPEVNQAKISHGPEGGPGVPPIPEIPIRSEVRQNRTQPSIQKTWTPFHRRSSQQKPEEDLQNRKSDTGIKSRKPLQPLTINNEPKRNSNFTSASSNSIDRSVDSRRTHQLHVRNRTRRLSKLYEQLRTVLKLNADTSQQHTLETAVRELKTSKREKSNLKSLNSALTSENNLLKKEIDRLEQELSRNAV